MHHFHHLHKATNADMRNIACPDKRPGRGLMCAVSDIVNQVRARPPQLFPREVVVAAVEGSWGVSRSVPLSWWLLTPLLSASSFLSAPPTTTTTLLHLPSSSISLSTPVRPHRPFYHPLSHSLPATPPTFFLHPSLPASISLIKIRCGVTAVKPAGCIHAAFIPPALHFRLK